MLSSEIDRIREEYNLLTPKELQDLRLKIGISCERADSLFGLKSGSYCSFENGLHLQSTAEDNLIRMTNVLNQYGRSMLPSYNKQDHSDVQVFI